MLVEYGTKKDEQSSLEVEPFSFHYQLKSSRKTEMSRNLAKDADEVPLGWHCPKQTLWVTEKQLF